MSLNSKAALYLCMLVMLVLILPPHLVGIDRFSDIDEPFWVINGSNYYYALTHGDFENTVYEYHPGVTTTWVVAAGMLAVFPEYRGFGQGYFDPYKWNFEEFLKTHGQQPLSLVRASRIIQTILLVALALMLFLLLQLLVDRLTALAAVVMAFNAPFFMGHSRLLNNEGLLAMFVIIAVVAMLVYLQGGRKIVFLLASGAAFGLAQLTKSPSVLVLGVIGLMLFVGLFDRTSGKRIGVKIVESVKILAIWLITAAAVYILFWPGMWVAPGKMLYEVYGNAFSYAFQGARLDVTQQLEPSAFRLNLSFKGEGQYLMVWALRSTPITWLGILLALPACFSRQVGKVYKALIGYVTLTGILFILLFGIAQGRNSAHYILSAFVCLDVVAGLGWGFGVLWLGTRWGWLKGDMARIAAFGLLAAIQIASALPYFPYYYTYPNPVLARTSLNYAPAYGEGLDLAANYLSHKQDAEGLRVFVYNGMGTFSYFFPGKVRAIKSPYFLVDGIPDIIQGMRWSQYIVVYTIALSGNPNAQPFLTTMAKVKPEHVIILYGQDYARVYRTADIPESIYVELSQ